MKLPDSVNELTSVGEEAVKLNDTSEMEEVTGNVDETRLVCITGSSPRIHPDQ